MTRLKNSIFTGVEISDVDVDSVAATRIVTNTQGDLALVFDKLTGSNAEANTIIHDGAGRGALLGIPIVNQTMAADYGLTGSLPGSTSEIYLASYLFKLPTGETGFSCFLHGVSAASNASASQSLLLKIYDTSGTLVSFFPFYSQPSVGGGQTYAALASGLTASTIYLVIIEANDLNLVSAIDGISICHPRTRSGAGWGYARGIDDEITVTAPAFGVAFTSIDSTHVADDEGLDAAKLVIMNANASNLAEYLTGVPSGGDETFAHVDSSTTNPAISQFFAHTRSSYASEPEIDFPVLADCLGALTAKNALGTAENAANAAEPPTSGLLAFYPPWVKSGSLSATYATLWQSIAMMPDFTTSSSKLKCRILVCAGSTYGATWTFRASTSAGNVTSSTLNVISSTLAYVEFSGIPFTPDAMNTLKIEAVKNAVRGIREISLVSVCWQFER